MPELLRDEFLGYEKEYLGVYVSGHPLDEHRNVLENNSSAAVLDIIEDEDGLDGDKLFEEAMEIDGVDDIEIDESTDEITEAEVTTAPNDLVQVAEALEKMGYHFSSAEVAYIPSTYNRLNDEEQLKNFGLMIELLDEDDDVQGVWHNLENEEDLP